MIDISGQNHTRQKKKKKKKKRERERENRCSFTHKQKPQTILQYHWSNQNKVITLCIIGVLLYTPIKGGLKVKALSWTLRDAGLSPAWCSTFPALYLLQEKIIYLIDIKQMRNILGKW